MALAIDKTNGRGLSNGVCCVVLEGQQSNAVVPFSKSRLTGCTKLTKWCFKSGRENWPIVLSKNLA